MGASFGTTTCISSLVNQRLFKIFRHMFASRAVNHGCLVVFACFKLPQAGLHSSRSNLPSARSIRKRPLLLLLFFVFCTLLEFETTRLVSRPGSAGSCLFTIPCRCFASGFFQIAGFEGDGLLHLFMPPFSVPSRIMLKTASMSSGSLTIWRPIDCTPICL